MPALQEAQTGMAAFSAARPSQLPLAGHWLSWFA